jgi:hypothetical protein
MFSENESSSLMDHKVLQTKQNAASNMLGPVAVLQDIAQKCNTKVYFYLVILQLSKALVWMVNAF